MKSVKRQRCGDRGLAPEEYSSGFGNEFSTEALTGALPVGQNNPQKCRYGLYAEQLSGTAFTAPRAKNLRSWLYRIQPSVQKNRNGTSRFEPMSSGSIISDWSSQTIDPNPMRWAPLPFPDGHEEVDFVRGLVSMAGAGDVMLKSGLAIHMYSCNASMEDTAFTNADGDMLIVPETGELKIMTEFGKLSVKPREVAVIPRGMLFSVSIEGLSRGYALEIYEGHFELPELGPIGSNGLANARDFLYPVASFEDRDEISYTLIHKFGGALFSTTCDHSPYDVVAWHGNYAPFKYDLEKFCCMNSVTFDHPDPSIYTVLTTPSAEQGVAVADFVIFPPRWMVMENTFRPPYFHRNCMTEFMGMIYGKYDAKKGFQAGGASLHNCMTAHGPDGPTFDAASEADLRPVKFDAGLAFMFETKYQLKVTKFAQTAPHLDRKYPECWAGCGKKFTGEVDGP